jgi:PAS domain-containing protein
MMISAPPTIRTASPPGPWLTVRLHDGVPPYLRSLARQVEPFPAAVLDGRGQILACNRGYDALFGLGSVPEPERNAILLYFTDPRLRRQLPEWHVDAPRVVSQFRTAMARHTNDPAWVTLLTRLRRGSVEFDRLWCQPDGFYPGSAPQRFLHPVVGVLRLVPYQLWSEPRPDGLVVTGYSPADGATAAKLPHLQALVR